MAPKAKKVIAIDIDPRFTSYLDSLKSFELPEDVEPAPWYPYHPPAELKDKYRQGRELGVVGLPQPGLGELSLSPDLSRVAASAWEGNSREIWRGPSLVQIGLRPRPERW